ncbi:hypothetical protein Cni_G23232 [Canna indica]|uniref:Uncharacterized protein n=1 Tax=Canna indica TaxID=4628 RepID=A0AAQ3KVS2_9LILI|nr:hypothetical protein Cni_G23232 [Canna indica]
MQFWQQLMNKQLQEQRRLQQLQQLDQEARQLTPHSQLAAVGKPAAGNQLLETLNEMPINDAYNYMWPNNYVGSMSNLTSNSQMFMAGNMNMMQPGVLQNLANGDIILADQNRVMRSMGFMPHQSDQSILGMPVSGTSSSDQYSQFLAMSNNCNDLMTKAAVPTAEKPSCPSSTFQNDQQSAAQGCLQDKTSATQYFQGGHTFDNSPMQILGNDIASGNFQQANNLQVHDQFHEFHGRQEQDDLSGNIQEKPVSQVGTSTSMASLDPIEQKLLFGTDDGNWGVSLGGSLGIDGDMHGHPSENDYSGAFPSINSGSWSALMQEAVQASSSDKGGLQEEWSGLSFQKSDQPLGKPLHTTNDNGKQPTAWDIRNRQNTTSLTSRSFPLFNDSNTTPSSSTGPRNRHLLESACEENNMISAEASLVSMKSTSQGANNKEPLNNQHQTKLIEGGLRGKLPSASGTWTGQTIGQHENSSSDIQFKSQEMGGGWVGQQNLPLSSVPIQPVNSFTGWHTSYPMISRGDNASNYHEFQGNLWKVGENHVTLNSGLQRAKSDIGSPKIQAEDSLAAKYGSVGNTHTIKLNQDMNQQVINEQNSVFGRHLNANASLSSEVEKYEENQKQPIRRLQAAWELPTSPAAERLSDDYEQEKGRRRVLPGKGYVGDAMKDLSGSQKSPVHYGQHNIGSKMFQSSVGNMRKAEEPSFPPNHQVSLQRLSNSDFDGSNGVEQSFGQSHFAGNVSNDDHVDGSKRIALEAEGMQSRNTIPAYASSSSFDRSTAQYSQRETVPQSSNNMLELLNKVDQSRNGNSVNVSDTSTQVAGHVSVIHPHFDPSSNLRGFGLRLAPPSQKQSLPNYVPNSKRPLNDSKVGQSGHEAGYQDQARSNYTSSVRPVPPTDEAFKVENWGRISSLSGQQNSRHPEENKFFGSLSGTADFPLMQEQQQLQQTNLASAKDHLEQKWQQQQYNNCNITSHEALDQSVKFSTGSQTNVHTLVKNASLIKHLNDSHEGAVASGSVQTSSHTLAGRFSTPTVASIAQNHVTGGSQISSGGIDHAKPPFAGFSQIPSSSHQLPVQETKSGSQSSTSGISQQPGFSRMLHNVWTNISAQQRQAGINPLLTPNVLQSIINHGRDRSSWGMPKVGDSQVNKEEGSPSEVGTSCSDSQREEENPLQGKSSNLRTEVDAACKSRSAAQREETALKPSFDGGSGVPFSSLVHLHQKDVNQAKTGQAPALSSQVLHSPPTSVASSSNDTGISGHMPKPSDVQPQNYSLLHQIQSMKASDSDLHKMSGNIAKEASFSSHATQMNSNMHQRYDHGQNLVSRFPADVQVGAGSQVPFQSDAKMLSFASNDNEEKNPSTSAAGQHDLQTQLNAFGTGAAATVLGGNERSRISPQMAPSWFEHYGTYQNGRMAALYDAQRSGKAPMQQYFLQRVPARMEDSAVLEQRLNSTHVGRQSTLESKISPSESSHSVLPPNIMDHGMILRSKKRKSVTADMPWHKIVNESPQSLEDISLADLDWNLVANRLMEKADDEAEAIEDDPSVAQSRRRIILTTKLMHQLVPAVPSALLKGEATSAYGSITFAVAKSALADACSLVSSSKTDLHMPLEKETTMHGELNSSKVGVGINTKFVEDFIDRSKKLEAEFSRLDKVSSMLDVRLECQDLERFSIVNRLGKFHGRAHADGVEVSSATGNVHRIFPQRYITALPVPGNLPEGIPCFSL